MGYAEAQTAHAGGLVIGVLVAAGIAWECMPVRCGSIWRSSSAHRFHHRRGRRHPRLRHRRPRRPVGWLSAPPPAHLSISVPGLEWSSGGGQLIGGVFNITLTPTVLQLVCWLAYLAVTVLTLFLRPTTASALKPASVVPQPERSAL